MIFLGPQCVLSNLSSYLSRVDIHFFYAFEYSKWELFRHLSTRIAFVYTVTMETVHQYQ